MQRLLIIGNGDVARRALPLLAHYRVYALSRHPVPRTQALCVHGDLDDRASLRRLAGLAHVVLHLAPPPDCGSTDVRTRNLLAALARGPVPRHFIYISTSGVYGNCDGAWVDETRRPNPQGLRAQRRLDAETRIRSWAARNGVQASILRVPGIYAQERLPVQRLRAGLPAIRAGEDSYSNHIHADDLARILLAALRHAGSNRVYHACDDGAMKMGDYFDLVADAHSLPRPPRIARSEAQRVLPAGLLSFLNESRRLCNVRLKRELRVRLRYPSVHAMLG